MGKTKVPLLDKNTQTIDVIFAILLLVATLSSAFCVYQATRWNGIQAEEFGNSAKFRTESIGSATLSNTQLTIDVQLFSSWVNAMSNNDTRQASFLRDRFRKEFKPAFEAWITEGNQEPDNPIPPGSPFDLPEYQRFSFTKSENLETEASAAFERAKSANDSGDQYIFITVLFAIVLFFCGIYSKWETPRVRMSLLIVTLVVFFLAFYNLATLLSRLGIV